MSYTLYIVHWIVKTPSECSDPNCGSKEDKYSWHLSEEDATKFIRQYYTEQKDSKCKLATQGPAKMIKHANGKTYSKVKAYRLREIFGYWATPDEVAILFPTAQQTVSHV